MSGVCSFCFAVGCACGIDLILSPLRSSRLVTLVLILETVFVIGIGAVGMQPTIGSSVAAATGVATGGLMLQLGILLPLWAPPVLCWANSRQASVAAGQ